MAGEKLKVEIIDESRKQKIRKILEGTLEGLTESELEVILGVDPLDHDTLGITLELQELEEEGQIVKGADGRYQVNLASLAEQH